MMHERQSYLARYLFCFCLIDVLRSVKLSGTIYSRRAPGHREHFTHVEYPVTRSNAHFQICSRISCSAALISARNSRAETTRLPAPRIMICSRPSEVATRIR